MPSSAPVTADDSVRRRRLVFRAWHRGLREMDLIMGRYADAHAATMPSADIDLFESLLEAPDTEVFGWITGSKPTPTNFDTTLLRSIRTFHRVPGTDV